MALTPHPVVVGVDGSAMADSALFWAASEARRRGVGLHIVHVFVHLQALTGYGVLSSTEPQDLGGWVCERATEKVRAAHPDLTTTSEVRVGPAAPELVEASRTAALLVLGAHGHGRITGRFVGSVSQQVTPRAHCPVVVVRRSVDDGPVVVGVDASEESAAALAFALEHAARRGVPVRVVHAEYVEHPVGVPSGAGYWYADLVDAVRQDTERVRAVVEEAARGRADVELQVVHDHPVTALCDAAEDASLLVVASRGLGGFTGLLLGSVSQGVLSHARCAVAVVHAPAATG